MINDIKVLFHSYFTLKDEYDHQIEQYKEIIQNKDKEIQDLKSDLAYSKETILLMTRDINEKNDSGPPFLVETPPRSARRRTDFPHSAIASKEKDSLPLKAKGSISDDNNLTMDELEDKHKEYILNMSEDHNIEVESLHKRYQAKILSLEMEVEQVVEKLNQDIETK